MGAVRLQRNATINFEGKRYRLNRLLEGSVWQLEEERTGRLLEISHSDLLGRYALRLITIAAPQQLERSTQRKPRALSAFVRPDLFKEAIRCKAYVDAILALPFTRGSAITNALTKVHDSLDPDNRCPSFATVARWRKAYIASGRDIASLVPRHDLRGRRERELLPDVSKIIEEVVDEVFLTLERRTIQDTRDEIEARIDRQNATRAKSEWLQVPSHWQVQKYIYSIPAYDRCLARYGYFAARARFRAVLSKEELETPLHLAQADHTRLDLMVVDEEYALPMGRPWLTVCLDASTRCVLGIYISFEPPSYRSVARCLLHAFTPKINLKAEYPEVEGDWDPHGVMQHLVVDNGMEFHSVAFEQACFELGIEVHYAPAKVAWFKGKVERFQGTLNRGTAHVAPGTTFSSILEKDDYDPKKHAIVTLKTLKTIVVKWVVDYYMAKPHRGLAKRIPITVWRDSVKPEDIRYPEDLTRLEAILGRPHERVLTHKGVELFGGLFYNSEDLRAWRCERGEKFPVTVMVDEGDIGHVIVTDGRDHSYRVPCNDLDYTKGLSLWQHNVCRRYSAERDEEIGPRSWIKAKSEIRELIAKDMRSFGARRKTHSKAARFQGSPPAATPTPAAADSPASNDASTPSSGCAPSRVEPARQPSAPPSNPQTATPTPKRFDAIIRPLPAPRL